MTCYYPDTSSDQAGLSFRGAPAVCCKATESTGYASADYGPAKSRAASAGAFFMAYHFLHSGNAAGQAAYCHGVVGSTPLMLDAEVTGSSQPGMGDITASSTPTASWAGSVSLVAHCQVLRGRSLMTIAWITGAAPRHSR